MPEYDIEQVESIEKFLKYWTQAMIDTHWFKEHILFHYTRNEMIEEITKEFAELDNLYLVATSKDAKEIFGVLRVKIKENIGTLGRWEPAVPVKFRNTEVDAALIQKAFSWLRANNVLKVKCLLRYPSDKPETGNWHIILYEKCGFKQKGPEGVMLLADLFKTEMFPSKVKNLHLVNRDEVSLEEFVDFTMKAYASTAEDRAIHGFDPNVSRREKNIEVLQAIKRGNFGFSPPECWKVALLEKEVVGFVIGFVPKEKYRPAHGVVASIGVFPEFRRKGIAYALINEIHSCFKKYGCRYSYVGTPKTNHPALRFYEKIGYRPVFELRSFEKTLTTLDNFPKQ